MRWSIRFGRRDPSSEIKLAQKIRKCYWDMRWLTGDRLQLLLERKVSTKGKHFHFTSFPWRLWQPPEQGIFFFFFFLSVASVFCLTPASKIWIFKKALITAHISSAEISNFLKILSLLSRLQPKAEHLPCKYHLGYASFLYFNNDSWCGVQSLQMRKSNK